MDVTGDKGSAKKISKVGTVVKIFTFIALFVVIWLIVASVASASTPTAGPAAGTPDADALWTLVADLIEKWVARIGAVVAFIGAVMFALGWKSDDAEQKSRGIQTLVAGFIVIAVAAMTNQFFA